MKVYCSEYILRSACDSGVLNSSICASTSYLFCDLFKFRKMIWIPRNLILTVILGSTMIISYLRFRRTINTPVGDKLEIIQMSHLSHKCQQADFHCILLLNVKVLHGLCSKPNIHLSVFGSESKFSGLTRGKLRFNILIKDY